MRSGSAARAAGERLPGGKGEQARVLGDPRWMAGGQQPGFEVGWHEVHGTSPIASNRRNPAGKRGGRREASGEARRRRRAAPTGPKCNGGLRTAELRPAAAGLTGSAAHPAPPARQRQPTAHICAAAILRIDRSGPAPPIVTGKDKTARPARWSLAAIGRLAQWSGIGPKARRKIQFRPVGGPPRRNPNE